jgi:YidC/Oxa1 family membrane protein insertase
MKKTKNKLKILLIISLVFLTTGCATTLTDKDKNPVKNEITGQNLIENIICKPTDKETIKTYEKNGVKIEKLPDCDEFKVNDGKYESLWTTFFIKPLSFIIIKIGELVKNYALAVILVSLAIRFIAYPITRKTALQSELMKKAQPEIEKIQKKYKDKQDQESMMKQNQELLAVYQKYNINPMSGCLFSMLQLPLFIAFFEAIQRTPAIFEDVFLGLQLGTTPAVGITSATFYMYAILVILIGATTYLSFKMNTTGNMQDPSMKMMPYMMTGMIIFTSLFMPTALGIYWITTNVFTIIQNILVKRSKEANGKA